MKKKLLFGFLGIVALTNLLIVSTDSTFLYPAVFHNFPDIDDYKIFENRTIHKSTSPQPWSISKDYNKQTLPTSLSKKLEELESVAFLVIKNDSIVLEKYWDDYSAKSFSNSFSAAKSHVSALIGFALKEGKIKSLNEPVANYVPSFKADGKETIKIIDVLKMSSGLNWEESYAGPLSMTTEAYYGKDIEGIINDLKPSTKPGLKFKYLSGDTQVLAMVLKSATGKSLSQLAEEKIWQPLGYENDAFWSVDKKNGVEKAYCCINSNARDFAKIAKLYIQNGNWNGEQLLDTSFVQASISPATYKDETAEFYGYMWWLFNENKDTSQHIFYARGILGQYIISIPEKNIIIVRLGHKRDKNKTHQHPTEIGIIVNAVNEMF